MPSEAWSSLETMRWNEFLKFWPTKASITCLPSINSSMYIQNEPWLVAFIFYFVAKSSIAS